jgi:hypothetical protein
MHARQVLRTVLPAALALSAQAARAQTPTLRYDKPAGFSGGGGDLADTYVSLNVDGLISVYPFQPITGEFRRGFLSTLYAERIEAAYRETRVLQQVRSDTVSIPGAEQALAVRFVADHSGYRREHARLAILSGGAVAIVDISSASPEAWQRNWPSALGVIQSLQVARAQAIPKTEPAVYSRLAGLYLGAALVFQANPSGGVGSGTWLPGTKWILLSPEGRVHRGIKLPTAPGGDIRRFDYDGAKRRDPGNAGTYSVAGTTVTLRMTGSGTEVVTADLTTTGDLEINGTTYRRSAIKE